MLAVMRTVGGMNRLEFPAGRVLFEDNTAHANRISVSPSGDRVAFVFKFNLHVTEPGGGVRDLHERAMEAVWCRATNEIWFNSVAGGSTELFAVVPGRPKRRVTTLPGDFVLHDISADGRVLLGRISESSEILGGFSRRGSSSESLPPRPLRGRGAGSRRRHRSFQRNGSERAVPSICGGPTARLRSVWPTATRGRFLRTENLRSSDLVPGPRCCSSRPDPDSPDSSPRPGCAAGDAWGSSPTAEGSGSWRRFDARTAGVGIGSRRREASSVDTSRGRGDDSVGRRTFSVRRRSRW